MREAAESESDVVLVPYEDAYEEGFEDMPRRIPDVSKIERTLGWNPSRDLTNILQDVIRAEREAGADASVREIA
jgi:UDP-glucose 4-epimerase